ncbi:MAG: hypothetical protein BAA02_08285 [Paenibacillaceae bacterium ZCTH02-B3]|nr:MAG: hypothetical protein BAA02_08285 [Paenibacillaceae bacterium ZCTH02-B3]
MFKYLLPEGVFRSVYEIDLNMLRELGLLGIIADLDNTLVSARTTAATPELARWVEGVRERGFRVVIVSNNRRARVSAIAEPLGVPYISSARKPLAGAFRQALRLLELPPERVAVIGDQLVTDVLGARRTGLTPFLVSPIAPGEEGLATQMNRLIERIARSRLRRKGLWPDGEGSWRG